MKLETFNLKLVTPVLLAALASVLAGCGSLSPTTTGSTFLDMMMNPNGANWTYSTNGGGTISYSGAGETLDSTAGGSAGTGLIFPSTSGNGTLPGTIANGDNFAMRLNYTNATLAAFGSENLTIGFNNNVQMVLSFTNADGNVPGTDLFNAQEFVNGVAQPNTTSPIPLPITITTTNGNTFYESGGFILTGTNGVYSVGYGEEIGDTSDFYYSILTITNTGDLNSLDIGTAGGAVTLGGIGISIAVPTPEPGTLALAALGGVASLFLFRRRN